jgi:hypothetical protein
VHWRQICDTNCEALGQKEEEEEEEGENIISGGVVFVTSLLQFVCKFRQGVCRTMAFAIYIQKYLKKAKEEEL